MGMDLYHFKLTPSKTDHYEVGRKFIQLKGMDTKTIVKPDDNFVHNCIVKALDKHDIPYQESHGKYCHDFTNGKAQVCIYTDKTVKEFKRLDKFIDNWYDDNNPSEAERTKAYDDYNAYGTLVANDESYWKDKILFSDIPLVNTYRVMGTREEINYARKPFREIGEKNMDAYRSIMDNCKGDPEGAFVVFDHESELDFKQLIRMIECDDMVNHLKTMLPIKTDELICIDW